MRADSISSISSPSWSFPSMSAANLWNIAEVKVFSIKRVKADQSFRADEMKVQTRSPCVKGLSMEKKRIDLIRRSLFPKKLWSLSRKEGIRVERERERRKKKYIRRSPRFRPKASGENSKYFKKKGKKEFLISIYSIRDTTKKRKKSNVLFCLRSWIKISMCEAYINPRCWEARMDHKSNVSVAIQIQHKFNVNTDTNMYYNISWWETSYWWAIIFIVESLCLGFG